MSKTAIVIGATGLVGSHLVRKLLQDESYSKVLTFTRRPLEIEHVKFTNHVIDFENLDEIKSLIQGDVIFSCLGTTLKQAGSVANFYRVDFTYQYNFIKMAAQNSVKELILISTPMANPKMIFSPYLKIKGELDQAVAKLPFERVVYIRPSLLVGERNGSRPMEELSTKFANLLAPVPGLRNFRPINGEIVAQAMLNCSKEKSQGIEQLSLGDIFIKAQN